MAIELQTNISLEATPNNPKHVINVKYMEDYFTGRVKMPVRAVSAANIAGAYEGSGMTFTYGATGVAVIDGVTLAANDRVLLVGQSDGTQNGIYSVTVAGDGSTAAVLTRASDFNSSDKIYSGVRIAVNEGSIYADTFWKLITDGVIVLDSTALVFIDAAPTAGASKYSETITGDNSATEFTVTHGLGTQDVNVVIRNLTTNAMVMTDVSVTDNNNVVIGFAAAPTPAQTYRVVVIG